MLFIVGSYDTRHIAEHMGGHVMHQARVQFRRSHAWHVRIMRLQLNGKFSHSGNQSVGIIRKQTAAMNDSVIQLEVPVS